METEMPGMQAKVRLYQGKEGGSLLGFAQLTVAGTFVIKDIRIVRSSANGPFVAFPSRKAVGPGESKFYDIAHPVTAEAHRRATGMILAAYREAAKI